MRKVAGRLPVGQEADVGGGDEAARAVAVAAVQPAVHLRLHLHLRFLELQMVLF